MSFSALLHKQVFFRLIYGLITTIILAWPGLAQAQLRIANTVTENFTPSRASNFACSSNVTDTSDGSTHKYNGYCPYSGQTTYEISYNFNTFTPYHGYDALVVWANSGNAFNDSELREFDLSIDYLDANGNAATLIMNDVNIGVTANDSDPKTVIFVDSNNNPVNLMAVTKIRMSNLRNQTTLASQEASFREVQMRIAEDHSDAPASYGETYHTITPQYYMGSEIDAETSAQSSTGSNGDDNDNLDDEDGVSIPSLATLNAATISVDVHQPTSGSSYLQGWIDWNGDGDFADSGEQIASDLQYTSGTTGTIDIPVYVPSTATLSQTYARFRWSTQSGLSSTAAANNGEVEDYSVTISSNPAATAQCQFGSNANHSLNAAATQIGTAYGGVASRAIDGNTDGIYQNNSTSHTNVSSAAWWQIDLGLSKLIDHINVWNRTDGSYITRSENYYLFISESPFPSTSNGPADLATILADPTVYKYQYPGIPNASDTIAVVTQGRYVRVQLPAGSSVLSLAEVEAMGCYYDRSDAPTSYGQAGHDTLSGFYLGSLVDTENSDKSSANADGDDTNGSADEDAVTFPTLAQDTANNINVTINQTTASEGYLQGWVDWNADGDFADSGEQVASDLQYSSGTTGTISVPISIPAAATLGETYARFRWSTTSGLSSTDFATDGEVEDYMVTIVYGSTTLDASKSVSIWNPNAENLYALPGNDVIYTISASNTGDAPTDTDSLLLIDAIPSDVEFYNGDIDDGGPETHPVSFTQSSGAGLTFTYSTDVGFSDSAAKPANFTQCTYAPVAGYDPAVTYICFNPKGALASGDPDPDFSVSFRAKIK